MRPPNVLADPSKTYTGGGGRGGYTWLGTGGLKKPSKFGPFEPALAFARSFKLASVNEWRVWCKEGRRPL